MRIRWGHGVCPGHSSWPVEVRRYRSAGSCILAGAFGLGSAHLSPITTRPNSSSRGFISWTSVTLEQLQPLPPGVLANPGGLPGVTQRAWLRVTTLVHTKATCVTESRLVGNRMRDNRFQGIGLEDTQRYLNFGMPRLISA